jgi:hypothetical protein
MTSTNPLAKIINEPRLGFAAEHGSKLRPKGGKK